VARIPGVELDGDRIGTSTEALAYPSVPEHLVVIGAGVIGLELGSVWQRLGSKVTVVEYFDRILPSMDLELGAWSRKILEKQGLAFKLGARVKSATRSGNACKVEIEGSDPITCDRVLLAVGRVPYTDGLGLEAVGVAKGKRGDVLVDDQFRTSVPGIYAIGDVARWPEPRSGEKVRIEHWMVAERHGEAVARSILGRGTAFRTIPFFWSAHYDLTINYVGHAPSFDRVEIDGDIRKRDAAVHYWRGDKLLAVATLGRDKYALEIERRFENE
jgi:pyruvate/2-oxoglutarate dehydrogenase complex dihydrolipoamide dehydrogenase (E3) component